MNGLMQHDAPLTVQGILERARTVGGTRTITTLGDEAPTRISYAELGDRVDRLCAGLAALGVGQGDRVATLCWNTQEHLECYLGVPSMGAVVHTLNPRYSDEQLAWIVNHAEDRVIVVDPSLAERYLCLEGRLPTVNWVVLTGPSEHDVPGAIHYDDLLTAGESLSYPRFDDRTAAALCYTSGTTGGPKGVLYSHRSLVLHAVALCMADSMGISNADRVLAIVPMFHANAWGLAQAAPLVGADLVLPASHVNAAALATAIEAEQVTLAAGVPTVWLDLLDYADSRVPAPDLSSLRAAICGGSAVPLSLMRAFQERHGVTMLQAWGMTEMSPVGAVSRPPAGIAMDSEEGWRYRAKTGRVVPLIEARIVDDDGVALPSDGDAIGELQVRGPWVASAYYRTDTDDKFDRGWMKTGDVVSIDPLGFIEISDRSKDLIKSGGEWISSVQLENELMAHEVVREAAVVAMPDERWGERPLACIVAVQSQGVHPQELVTHLSTRVPRWWIPDAMVLIDEIPRTSVGKFDKRTLRSRLQEGTLGELLPMAAPAGGG
jgi:fatty-acyl-CoA synthase